MSRRKPPRLATLILMRCAPEDRRDSFIGDLVEQYGERGAWWYWRQVAGAIRTRAVSMLVTTTETDVPMAEFIGDLTLWIALGLCAAVQFPVYARLLMASTPLVTSELNQTVVSVISGIIAATLISAVVIAREVRVRIFRSTALVYKDVR